MINKCSYIILLMSFLITNIVFFYYYFKAMYAYFTDGADLRVCTITQAMTFVLLIMAELVSYFFVGHITFVGVYLFRTYLSFMFYFLAASRLLGYKSLFFPKRLKNISYTVITLLFYVTTIVDVFYLRKLEIPNVYDLQWCDGILISLRSTCNSRFHFYLHAVPIFYSMLCFLLIMLFDFIEKRGSKTLLVDILLDLPILFASLINLCKCIDVVQYVFCTTIFIIPMVCIIYEINNILRYCSKEQNEKEYINNLIKRTYKSHGVRRIYNARLISKVIKENPRLEALLPDSLKYKDFIKLIKYF